MKPAPAVSKAEIDEGRGKCFTCTGLLTAETTYCDVCRPITAVDLRAAREAADKEISFKSCCDAPHSQVRWNPFNRVVQCHACGAVWLPVEPGTWAREARG